ncbi:MAG: pilus assembly protein CpaF [Rhodospirillaceae bacterium]|nr:pilus assembly protein CpaF [Rhodospirillales bacterium]
MLMRVTIDGFALTPDVAEVMKAVRDDRTFAKARMEVYPGGLAGAIAHYHDKPSPQVIVVEEDNDDATLLTRLEDLAEVCEPGTRVIVIGALNDIKLYRTLIGNGVSEYLLRPLVPRQLMDAVSTLFADPTASPKGRLVVFWGARGGAGSSTLAQNLAWAIGRGQSEAVVYVDLDLAFGTSQLAFNLDAKQHVAEALGNPERLDGVLLDRFLAAYDDGLKVLSSAGEIRQCPPVTLEAVDKLLDLACRMAPVVVVDLPHLWADWTEHLLVVADELVVTAVPNLASLRDTKALLDLLTTRRGEGAAPRLVLNKIDAFKKTQLSPKDFEETLGVKPALLLPFEPQLFGQAANNGQMLAEANKGAKINEQLSSFAVQLSARSPARSKAAKSKSLLDWLRK